MDISWFPVVNASLNSLCTLLLVLGWLAIRGEQKGLHIACMVSALIVSSAFLACYLYYHKEVGSVKFLEQGWIRPVYFTILLTHTVLAAAVVPLVIITVIPALRGRFDKHRKWARWTLPIWLYVSVTGVVIYFVLYQWFPPENLGAIWDAARES